MSTQPYKSPDLESSTPRRDQDLEPIAADAAEQLGKSPAPPMQAQKTDQPRSDAEGGARAGQSPTEAPNAESDEEEADLDDALDDSFPASDPVSSTSTPKKH